MTDRNASKRVAVTIAGLFAVGGYGSQALADDTSDQALRDQVKALQKQVEELSKKVNAGKSGSAEAPKSAVDQSPTPNRAVNAKEAEVPPKTAGPPPITWNGITLYGTVDIGVAHLSHGAPLSQTYGPGLPFTLQSFSNHPITSPGGQRAQSVEARSVRCRAAGCR